MTTFDPEEGWSSEGEQADEQDRDGLAVDVYGVKGRSKLPPIQGGEQPESLRDLGRRVWRSLLKVCNDAVGLLADTFDAGRSVVQGIGGFFKGLGTLPGAAAKWIAQGREQADKAEAKKQLEHQSRPALAAPGPASLQAAHEIEKRLLAKLAELREMGVGVELVQRGDAWVVALVLPEQRDAAVILGAQELAVAEAVQRIESQARPAVELLTRSLEKATALSKASRAKAEALHALAERPTSADEEETTAQKPQDV